MGLQNERSASESGPNRNPGRSAIHQVHHVFGVALAGGGAVGRYFVDAPQIVGGEFHVQGGDVFFQIIAAFGTGDGDDVVAFGKQPGQGELTRSAVLFFGQLFNTRDEIEILLKVFALEAWRKAAIVIFAEVLEFFDLACQEPTAERAVSNEGDAQFTRGRKDFIFGIARPKRVFRLQGCDGMNGVSAANGGGRSFGKAEETDFSFAHQLSHGAHGFFDRSLGINAMLVIKVDRVDVETLEAGFTAGAHVFGPAVDSANVGIGAIADDGKFGGKENFVAAIADGSTNKDFIVPVAVHIGGVEKIDSQLDRTMDSGDGFVVVARAVKF
jgi:hypothetical protein